MTKIVSTLVVCMSLFAEARAQQDLAGFRTGNYTGVNGVFFNPANIADNHYRWDVNILGVNANVSNNQAKFNLSNLGDSFDGNKVTNQIFGKNAGPTSGLANFVINMPSAMFSVGPKMAFAITSRTRVLANVTDMDGQLADKITNDAASLSDLPYTISSNSNMRVNVTGWAEIGVSFAREAFVKGPHYFKAGGTIKYLMGVGNANIYLNNFKGTINADILQQDAYLSNSTANVGLTYAGTDISNFDANQLTKFSGHGVGADLGMVYEWRPEWEVTRNAAGGYERSANQYKLKVGVSLLDIGRISFEKDMQRSASYNMAISNTQRFYLSELSNVSLDDYRAKLDQYPQYFGPDGSNSISKYSVSLPSTLHIDVDYHLHNKFYINAGSQIALTKGTNKPYNGQYYSGFSITPRFEGCKYGFFLPLSYNSLTKFNAGFSLRAGPLYVGSGSVLSALLGDSKQADVFIGFRFGQLYRTKK